MGMRINLYKWDEITYFEYVSIFIPTFILDGRIFFSN